MSEIQLNNAILHVYDHYSNVIVYSKEELNCAQKDIAEYITKHIEKTFKDPSAIVGVLSHTGYFAKQLLQYRNAEIRFVEYSAAICKKIFSCLLQTDNRTSVDCIVCNFEKNGDRYIGILELPNQVGFTHKVVEDKNLATRIDIVRYYSILPTLTQRIAAFAIVNVDTLSARYLDQRRFLNGKDVSIISDYILECSNMISPKSAVNTAKSIALQLSEQYGKNSAAVVSRMKAFLAENAETSDNLDTAELSHRTFPESEKLAEKLEQQIQQQGIPSAIPIDRSYAIREGKKHRIKTDTGIELTIPSDFFDNPEYIEFINNSNGTISIAIKNIGRISNK